MDQETRNGALKTVYNLYTHFGVAKSANFEGGSGQVLPECLCTHVGMFIVGDHIFTFVKQLVLVQIIKRCLV